MRNILAALLVLMLCGTSTLWADGFGYDGEGIAAATIEDTTWANRSTPASSGVLDSGKVWVEVTTEAHLVKFAVYQWSDTSFVDSTYEIDVPVGEGWVYFQFVNNNSITASTEYALAIVAEATAGDCKVDLALGGTDARDFNSGSDDQWQTPKWTTVNATGTFKLSIWCFYTPEAAAGQVIMIQ